MAGRKVNAYCIGSKNRLQEIFTKNPERNSETRNRSAAGSWSNLKTKQVAKILGRKKGCEKKTGRAGKGKSRVGCRARGAWRPGRRLCQYCCACPTKCSKSALLLATTPSSRLSICFCGSTILLLNLLLWTSGCSDERCHQRKENHR